MLLECNIYVHRLRKVTAEQTSAILHSTLTIHGSRSYHNSAQSLKLSYTQLGCRKNHCAVLRFQLTYFLSKYLSYKSTDQHRSSVSLQPSYIHSLTQTHIFLLIHTFIHSPKRTYFSWSTHSFTHSNAHISLDPYIHSLTQTHIFFLIHTFIHSPKPHISLDPYIHSLAQMHIFLLIHTFIHSHSFLCSVLFCNVKSTYIF
jgi:hypothetical protein